MTETFLTYSFKVEKHSILECVQCWPCWFA